MTLFEIFIFIFVGSIIIDFVTRLAVKLITDIKKVFKE